MLNICCYPLLGILFYCYLLSIFVMIIVEIGSLLILLGRDYCFALSDDGAVMLDCFIFII